MQMIIETLLLLTLFVGAIVLQIFLSYKKNKLLGFILPCITFITSILAVFTILGFITINVMTALPGSLETKSVLELWNQHPGENTRIFISVIAGRAANNFIFINTLTVVFLLINFICKKKQRKNSALQKMSVQDLW